MKAHFAGIGMVTVVVAADAVLTSKLGTDTKPFCPGRTYEDVLTASGNPAFSLA